jgi:hypothetical protein
LTEEINDPSAGETNLVRIACWASFAVWKSIAGFSARYQLERSPRRHLPGANPTRKAKGLGKVYVNIAPRQSA